MFKALVILFIVKLYARNNILKGVSFISGKSYHVALTCFHYLCMLLVQSKPNNIKTTLLRDAFKLLCYF